MLLTVAGTVVQLNNVQQIQASQNAFAAVLDDGSVVTWGAAGYDCSAGQLNNVQQIQPLRGLLPPFLVMDPV